MKVTKLKGSALNVAAALMGVSNMGLDHVFKEGGRSRIPGQAEFTVDDAAELVRDDVGIEFAVHAMAQHYFETETAGAGFVKEAEGWVKKLRTMPVDEMKSTWTRYVEYFDAIAEAQWFMEKTATK